MSRVTADLILFFHLAPGAKAKASSSFSKRAGLKLSILIPLVLVIVLLVAVIIIQAYRQRRHATHAFAPPDFMRMTVKDKDGGDKLLTNEQETSH